MEEYRDSIPAINTFINVITLTRYIDGLGENLSMYVRSYRPTSLEEAHEITMQYANAAYRQKLDQRSRSQPVQTQNQNSGNHSRNYNHNQNPNISQNNSQSSSQNTNTNRNQNTNPPANNNQNSGRFRRNVNDDVSMRTQNSQNQRMQINHHSTDNPESEIFEPDPVDDSTIDSADDDFFEGEELNFHREPGQDQTG